MSLTEMIKARDVVAIKALMLENDLILDGTKIVPRDAAAKEAGKKKAEFWNQRQQAR